MSLWTPSDAEAATNGEARGTWQAEGVSIDTRTLRPGDLFVALESRRDGHEFVAEALRKGAAAAMVSHLPDGVSLDDPLLVVEDVMHGLEDLGREGRLRMTGRVGAITGSVGKTTAKEMAVAMLAGQGRVHASVASYNNHWGVPLTLARMPPDVDYAVVEIGMSGPGEIAPLAALASPHAVLVTAVAKAHLEAFGSLEGIASEKASISMGLEPGGAAVLPGDSPMSRVLVETVSANTFDDAKIWRFGRGGLPLELVGTQEDEAGIEARIRVNASPATLRIGARGEHFASCALGALGLVWALGADRDLAIEGLAKWRPTAGRGARESVLLPEEPGRPALLIDDSYNANPASMVAGLEMLAAAPASGERVAILGDMKELGPEGPALHAALAESPALQAATRVHSVGPLMRSLHDALGDGDLVRRRGIWVESAAELVPELPRLVGPGDAILVKGSNSMGLSAVVDAIRNLGESAVAER